MTPTIYLAASNSLSLDLANSANVIMNVTMLIVATNIIPIVVMCE